MVSHVLGRYSCLKGQREGLRDEGPAGNGHLDRLPNIPALFAAGAEVTADATEYLRSSQCAKAAGDFLSHFDHADVLLGLIVGEGHPSIPQESQDAPVKILQPI